MDGQEQKKSWLAHIVLENIMVKKTLNFQINPKFQVDLSSCD